MAGTATTTVPAVGEYRRRIFTALTSASCVIHDNDSSIVKREITQAERDKLVNVAVVKKTFVHNGHGFSVGDPVHELGSTFIPLITSQANSRFGSSGVGIVVEVPSVNSVVVQFSGITDAITGVTNGAERYLSDVTQGAILTAPPTTVGSFIRHLYTGLEGGQIFIHDSGTVEILPTTGAGEVSRSGTTEQYELSQFQGDTDIIEGSGIVLVEEEGARVIAESSIQGYVAPPTNTVALDVSSSPTGLNLNVGSFYDIYVNKIAIYSGSSNIVLDVPTYGGTDGSGTIQGATLSPYAIGDVFAVRNNGTGNVTLRVINTPGGTIQPLGTTSVVVAPGGYAAINKTATNLLFELLNQAGQNAPTSQSNVIATRFEQEGGNGFTQTSSGTLPVTALTLVDMDLVIGEVYEITWTGQVTTTDASNEAIVNISKQVLNNSPIVSTSLDEKGIREALSNTPGPEVMIIYYTAITTEQVDFTVGIRSYDDTTTVTVANNTLKIQRIS